MDTYLSDLVRDSIGSSAHLSPSFFADAERLRKNIPALQIRAEELCKLIVDPDHVRTIISVDAMADGKTRQERVDYLQTLKPEASCAEHRTALECILVSERLLAMDGLSLDQIVYHRARSFAYSLIFMLKPSLLPIFLLGTASMAYTCQFALAAVMLDDADDYEDDRLADSPTLFTRANKDQAVAVSRTILAHLESLHKTPTDLLFLDTREFLLLASMKIDEFAGAPKRPSLDTNLLLRRLAREHWHDTWRGI